MRFRLILGLATRPGLAHRLLADHWSDALHIGVCRLSLHLPEVRNLKAKRQVSRSLTARIRNQFNVSVAEVEDNDLWQRLTLGVTCVSNDSAHANEVLSRVVSFVESARDDLEVLDYDTEIISGV